MSNQLDYEINKELGECYLFMGDMDKAEEYYQKACASNGVHPEPYLGLATIAVQRGELDSALGLYNRAAEIEPSDKAATGVGLILMETGNQEAAFEQFILALSHNPENMVAIFGLVQTGSGLKRIPEVLPHLEKFLALAPNKDDVRFTLAGCLVSMGRKQDACAHLDTILANDPENEPAKELYAQLNQ